MSVALIGRISVTHMREETVYLEIFVGLNAFDKLNGIFRLDTNTMHSCINGDCNADNHIVIFCYLVECF